MGWRFGCYAGWQSRGAHFATFGKALHRFGIELDGQPASITLRTGGFLFDHNGTHHAIKFGIGWAARRIDHALNAIPGGAAPGGEGTFLRHHAIFRRCLRRHAALRQRAHVAELRQCRQGGQAQPKACESRRHMFPSGHPPGVAFCHHSLPFTLRDAITTLIVSNRRSP